MNMNKPALACLILLCCPPASYADTEAEASEISPSELAVVQVVSARRRSEPAQEIPASISLQTGEQLAQGRIEQIQDLPQKIAGLNSNFLHARESALAIRGIGNNAANEGLQGSVGLYLDNVYLARPGMLAIELFDLAQVEVLRGPQGTLFGRNTTAGVVHLSSRQPVFEPQASVAVSLGNRNYQQIQGVLNTPLNEHTALRLSVYDTHDDGWLKNHLNATPLNEINRKGLRLQTLSRPDSDTSLRLILEHHEEDSTTGTLIPYAYGPWNRGSSSGNLPLGVAGSNASTYGERAQALGSSAPPQANPARYEVWLDGEQRARTRQEGASLEINRRLGRHQLTSITAWRSWQFRPDNDVDNTPLFSTNGGSAVDHRQFSQEIRLASPLDEHFDYVIGTYFLHQNTEGNNRYTTGPYALALNAVPNQTRLYGRGELTLSSLATFGQASWHLNESLDMTLGVRATQERLQGRVEQQAAMPAFPYSPLFLAYDSGTMRNREDSFATHLGLSYRLNEHALAYLSHARSEKSGGYNLYGVLTPASLRGNDVLGIRPEKASAFEAGIKSRWPSLGLLLNTNLFQTRVTDYQASSNFEWQNTYVSYLSNVGNITSRGVEQEGRWQARDNLAFRFALAWLDARFDSGSAPTPFEEFNGPGATSTSGYGQGTRSLAGKRVNGAPRWTANLGTEIQWPVRAWGGTQYFDANYAWRSSSFGDINNSSYSRIPAYGLLNLATGWRGGSHASPWEASLWVRNVFDKRYFLALLSGQNAYFASAGQARTVGVSLKFNF